MSLRVLTWFALVVFLMLPRCRFAASLQHEAWVLKMLWVLSISISIVLSCESKPLAPTHWTLGDVWAYPCCVNVPWVIMRSRYISFLVSSKHALSHLILNSPASGSLWHLLSQTLCKGIPVLQGTGTVKLLTLQIWDPSKPHRPLMIQSAAWRKEACRCSSWLPETVREAICTWKTFKTAVAT